MPSDDVPATGPHAEPLRPVTAAEIAAAPFPYLRWAKAHLAWDPLCLGMSGLTPIPSGERELLGLSASPEVGDARAGLKEALAARYGMSPENVHPTAGTSHANFITYLTLARGGHVAAETPGYEALHRVTHAVGASLSLFRRDPARDWRIDPGALAAAVSPATSLLVVTDLHNPSGARLHEADLDLLLATAEAVDAHVLVDEVYLDFDAVERPTAALRHPRVVTTNSLTKVHGLPDLRAGWILGAPDVIARIDGWDDLVHPSLPPAPMREAARFVPQARARLAAIRAAAGKRAAQVDAWVEATPGVTWTLPVGGLTGWLRLTHADGDAVAEHAWAHAGVRVVPGSFFQDRRALRISYLLAEAELARALEALARSIEACA